jgi:pyridoxine 5'-phosphate synthase PdxJ
MVYLMAVGQLRKPCLNISIFIEVHEQVAKASKESGVPMYEIASEAIALTISDSKAWKQLIDRLAVNREQSARENRIKRKEAIKVLKSLSGTRDRA